MRGVFPPAAYLRVYEPLSAFPDTEGRRWAAYAASANRPRRASALAAEQAGALRRLIARRPVAAPECESGDAYVRWSGGMTYICPWQTRLRSWLALARLGSISPPLLAAAFPSGHPEAAASEFARWEGRGPSLRVHIQASTWTVPCEWFVPFAPDERWLVLGGPGDQGDGVRATASTRALVYATALRQAKTRVVRALDAMHRDGTPEGGALGEVGVRHMRTGLAEVAEWLAEFHPEALVELDYGGLVHLFDDAGLKADQSVAEVSAGVNAIAAGELELAVAMHRRLTGRWQPLEALAVAS